MAEQKWFEGLRRQIKHRCGPGWGIDERHGGVRLTRRIAAGKQHKNPRQTVQLGIPWNPAHSGDIFLVVCQIRERMENGEESLAKAFQLQQKQHGSTPTVSKSVEDEDSGWEAVIDDFIDRRRQVNRATTMRDLSCHMKRVLKTLDKKPRPQSGADLMRAYARQHFKHCRPGGSGRVVQLNNVRALLSYAIKEYGYDSRWKPLEADDLRELIGTDDRPTEDKLTPPVRPNDLGNLLDALRDADRLSLMLLVGIVGIYGLRPHEVAQMIWEDGHLKIRPGGKRNKATRGKKQKNRLVLPFDVPGREGEGERLVMLWRTGAIRFPQAVLNRINEVETKGFKPVGDEIRQQLERFKFWQGLKAAHPGLSVYSLRHGAAYRMHKSYDRPLSIRDASALLGHSPAEHHASYGMWTDEFGLIDSVARITGAGRTTLEGDTLSPLDLPS
jgi:integrase